MRRLVLLILLAAASLTGSGRVYADDENPLADLWLDLSISPPLVDIFNERAEPADIARVEHISQLDLLADITVGKRLVVFKSAADAMRLLPHIHEELDIVGYNLEHGPANPIFEQENPLESIQRLREVTDQYDLELALGPDRRFAESDGAAMAPFADYFILQVQKVQTDPDTVYAFVDPLITDLQQANPDIQISLQIRTEGKVEELFELLDPLQDKIDGISILTSEETLPVTEEIVDTLRPEARIAVPTPETKNSPEPRSTDASDTVEATESVAESDEPATLEPDEVSETVRGSATTELVSEAESTERTGSTALFIVIALVVGFALGAGYVSHRTGS